MNRSNSIKSISNRWFRYLKHQNKKCFDHRWFLLLLLLFMLFSGTVFFFSLNLLFANLYFYFLFLFIINIASLFSSILFSFPIIFIVLKPSRRILIENKTKNRKEKEKYMRFDWIYPILNCMCIHDQFYVYWNIYRS